MRRFTKKKLLVFIAMVLSIITFQHRHMLGYGIGQAYGQFSILSQARPVGEVLQDPTVATSVKKKIEWVRKCKQYGEQIGLKPTSNYETYYDQKGKPVLWNLSACLPYQFQSYEWSFPFLGTFAYKGFFDLQKARKEEETLQSRGYDTRIRSVSAWSTLGWFRDPILSGFLDRPDAEIAETIFHELTHATLFVRDSLDFNENLASFMGKEITRRFLVSQYGDTSFQYREYMRDELDTRMFREHILRGKDTLDSLYASWGDSTTEMTKKESKIRMIRQIAASLDTLSFTNQTYRDVFRQSLPNNAYFMGFNRYFSQEKQLENLFESCNRDFVLFIAHFSSQKD